jgi:cell division septum initiation protein DivIVA
MVQVSEEAARLQDQVDELEKELKAARAQGQAGPTSGSPPSSSSEEVANLRRTAATLQEDLARAKVSQSVMQCCASQ